MFLHPKEEEAKSRGDALYTARRGIFGIAQLVFYANGVVHLGGTALFKCYAHSKRRRSLWEPNHFANALPSATYDHLF